MKLKIMFLLPVTEIVDKYTLKFKNGWKPMGHSSLIRRLSK